MRKTARSFLAVAGIIGIAAATAAPALAHDGDRRVGIHLRHHHRLHATGLLGAAGIGAEIRADLKAMTLEERETYREEAREFRAEQRAEVEAFVGTDGNGIRKARKEGATVGALLEAQGKTEADADAFLSSQGEAKVGWLDERHDLDAAQETTLRARIGVWIEKVLGFWF